MARVLGAHGLKGGISVAPFSGNPGNLVKLQVCWILLRGEVYRATICSAKAQMERAILTIQGIGERDAAEALAGGEIHALRESLSKPGADAYYWIDLIGCSVENTCGANLGLVSNLISTGAHDVLEISQKVGEIERERLIPFVSAYVSSVDIAAKRIVVDWDASWD